jgi:hypothetical protein
MIDLDNTFSGLDRVVRKVARSTFLAFFGLFLGGMISLTAFVLADLFANGVGTVLASRSSYGMLFWLYLSVSGAITVTFFSILHTIEVVR